MEAPALRKVVCSVLWRPEDPREPSRRHTQQHILCRGVACLGMRPLSLYLTQLSPTTIQRLAIFITCVLRPEPALRVRWCYHPS